MSSIAVMFSVGRHKIARLTGIFRASALNGKTFRTKERMRKNMKKALEKKNEMSEQRITKENFEIAFVEVITWSDEDIYTMAFLSFSDEAKKDNELEEDRDD